MTDKQRYTTILENANELMRDAEQQAKEDYLINKRIFNNAFAALMKIGVPASVSEDGSVITVTAGSNSYITRAMAISQILRDDYEVLLDLCLARTPKQDKSDFPLEVILEDANADLVLSNFDFDLPSVGFVSSSFSTPINETDGPAYSVREKEVPEEAAYSVRDNDNTLDLNSRLRSISGSCESDTLEYDDASPLETIEEPECRQKVLSPFVLPEETFEPDFSSAEASDEESLDESSSPISETVPASLHSGPGSSIGETLKEDASDPKGSPSFVSMLHVVEQTEEDTEPYHLNFERKVSVHEPLSIDKNERGGAPDIDISNSAFHPKNQRHDADVVKIQSESSPENTKPAKKGVLFSIFRKKEKQPAYSVREPEKTSSFIPEASSAEYSFIPNHSAKTISAPAEPHKETYRNKHTVVSVPVPDEDYTHDGGELFQHIKNVGLKKKLGNDTLGPYRFIFWPTTVPKTSDRCFAEILVYILNVEASEGHTFICDRSTPELRVQLDGKDFKIYGLWENGVFTSHVSLTGMTASIFDLVEQTEPQVPDIADDIFYDQFRYERKGQPKHFVVPFKNSNRGERNIPITGYIEWNGKRKVLERSEGNRLMYSFGGRDYVITGHYEHGKFTFKVDAQR